MAGELVGPSQRRNMDLNLVNGGAGTEVGVRKEP